MSTIKEITRTNEPFHPAVGDSYLVELTNSERFRTTDDELIGMYSSDNDLYEDINWPQILVGKSWLSE